MLAQLEQLDGVERAEVDFAAEYLRVRVRDDAALAAAIALLDGSGYGAEVAGAAPTSARWYDRSSVGELSRVEADVIAGRVVAAYRVHRAVSDDARLRAAIVETLHAGFLGITLGAGPSPEAFRADCVARTVAAVTPIVGASDAGAIGALLDDDMRRVHRKPGLTRL